MFVIYSKHSSNSINVYVHSYNVATLITVLAANHVHVHLR